MIIQKKVYCNEDYPVLKESIEKINFRVKFTIKEKLKELAVKENTSISELLRKMIEDKYKFI